MTVLYTAIGAVIAAVVAWLFNERRIGKEIRELSELRARHDNTIGRARKEIAAQAVQEIQRRQSDELADLLDEAEELRARLHKDSE